ncbi:hypothetical protein WR25_16947 isoform A [Diploscapter pachys]|uniref:Uncharacterized protein n=2 Tax=Diploscapter pachys TaxID=2018661 RepID=A0A2A2KQR2_9BILA|nr:hypothetical protein WR25_16947 isoform A [Diploscapter pachys]
MRICELIFLFCSLYLVQAELIDSKVVAPEPEWELIGSRTYKWEGSEFLRCKHWDKVAVRWHLSMCGSHADSPFGLAKRGCKGGTNADYATNPQNHMEIPRWRNAFTYVQLPGQEKEHEHLRLGVEGLDSRIVRVKTISPLKIDVDWKWQIDEKGCNLFYVRMSAMSTIEKHRLGELENFCKSFDLDKFVDCSNL